MRSIAWKRWALEELRCRARQGKTGLPPDGLEIGGFSRNRDYRLCSPDILVILHVVLICFDIYIYTSDVAGSIQRRRRKKNMLKNNVYVK